jgi:ribosomal protein L32
MAVPKKKISYSKTRKRLLSNKKKLILYTECKSCLNFKKIHNTCTYCSLNTIPSTKLFKTNIKKVFHLGF